jgi:hypothetical protein
MTSAAGHASGIPATPGNQMAGDVHQGATRRVGIETKPSFKTTEFFVFLAAVVAVVITALTVDGDANTGGDPFNAEQALRYITFLAIGYMVSRGIAKAGSRTPADPR